MNAYCKTQGVRSLKYRQMSMIICCIDVKAMTDGENTSVETVLTKGSISVIEVDIVFTQGPIGLAI